jgi:hypothetical protein
MKKRDLIKELLEPLTFADGTRVPDEAFENDLTPCETCEAAGKVCEDHEEKPAT